MNYSLKYSPKDYQTLKIMATRVAVTLGIAYAALSMTSLEKRCESVEYRAK